MKFWHEKAPGTLIPPSDPKVTWQTLRKQGVQDEILQSLFVFVGRTRARGYLKTVAYKTSARIFVVDWQIQTFWTTAETHIQLPPAAD